MICPHCGATLSSAARFCTQCGQTLAVAAANSNDNVEDSTVLGTAPHGTAAAPQPEAPAPVVAFPEPVPAPQAAAPQPEPAPAFPGAEQPTAEPAFPAVPEPVPAQKLLQLPSRRQKCQSPLRPEKFPPPHLLRLQHRLPALLLRPRLVLPSPAHLPPLPPAHPAPRFSPALRSSSSPTRCSRSCSPRVRCRPPQSALPSA